MGTEGGVFVVPADAGGGGGGGGPVRMVLGAAFDVLKDECGT